jgi:hypothetical protein
MSWEKKIEAYLKVLKYRIPVTACSFKNQYLHNIGCWVPNWCWITGDQKKESFTISIQMHEHWKGRKRNEKFKTPSPPLPSMILIFLNIYLDLIS